MFLSAIHDAHSASLVTFWLARWSRLSRWHA